MELSHFRDPTAVTDYMHPQTLLDNIEGPLSTVSLYGSSHPFLHITQLAEPGKPPPAGSAKRGKITGGLNSSSRIRLLTNICQLPPPEALPEHMRYYFLTLTLDGDWSYDRPPPMSQFYALYRFLRRRGLVTAVWRKEHQKRGAPHWHILILQDTSHTPFADLRDDITRHWLALNGIERNHPRYAAHVEHMARLEVPRDNQRIRSYMCKELAKTSQSTCEAYAERYGTMGRHWGIWCRAAFDELREPVRHIRLPRRKAKALATWLNRLIAQDRNGVEPAWRLTSTARAGVVEQLTRHPLLH